MTFSELLNHYLEILSLSGKELSERSGVSQATISRYRRGEIEPSMGGTAFPAIIAALAGAAEDREVALSEEELRDQAEACLAADEKLYEVYLQNLRVLLKKAEYPQPRIRPRGQLRSLLYLTHPVGR